MYCNIYDNIDSLFDFNPLKWIMDRYEKCSLVALFIAYKVIILLIVIYKIMEVLNQTNIKYRQSFYILALVLFIILFIYYVHIALYHCPKAKNVEQGEGKEENQTGNFHPV